jgi:ABC-type transport system substrate-binding protein
MNTRWTVLRPLAISCLLAALALPIAARTRPHYGGTLHVEIEGDPWQRPDGLPRRLVFDGLTTIDASGNLHPALAIQWESDNTGHRWQFHLHPGVQFHDGSPLTAQAVVASLTASCTADCPWTAVHAVGSSVVFTGDSPMPNLPVLLAGGDFLISLTVNPDGSTTSGAIGTGPFQLAGFNNGVLTLTANPNSWQGRPFVDTVEIRVHRAVREQWLDLGVGRTDVVEVPAEQLRQAAQQRLQVVSSPHAALLVLQLASTGPLENPALRAAIAMAVDRGSLYNVIFQKQGEVTAGIVPQALSGYAFLYPADRDLNKSHELRGGASPPPLKLSVEGDGATQLAAQRIALNLREAGFNVQVAAGGSSTQSDLTLRTFSLESTAPPALIESLARAAGRSQPVIDQTPVALFKTERDFLDRHTFIPLLDLPRAWAFGGRVRDLQLLPDGTPDLADTSLEDAP